MIGQQTFKNDADKLKYANKVFDEEKYQEAYTYYLQLLPSNRLDPDINFRYGTCLMKTTENKADALPYLNFAASKNADARVHFFLGKTYHLLYRFGEAQKHYKDFQAKGTPDDKEKYQVDLHIKMTQSGKKLLSNLTELIVDAKTQTTLEKFPYSYDLSEMGGRIIISEEFQSKYDAKLGFRSMTYIPPIGTGNDVIFYSSYGKDGKTGLDLYAIKRLPNGDWGESQRLPDHINTPYDDAYGFLHSSKTVFYFCSKGHNSMGGFDVFKCSYDITTNSFGPPINLDYKINTPDDELMYVVDSLEENAYFASSRGTKFGFVDVYKVRVETFPIVNVLLAGNFDNKINQNDVATIKIQDIRNDEIIGIYNPNKANKYTIILPKSGSYNFIVETENSEKIHTSNVVIPPQKEFRPLKQKIILTNEGGVEKLIIQNLFDEEFDEAERESLLAEAMQLLANPDVNAGQFEEELNGNALVDSVLDGSNVRLEDLVSMSKTMYEDAQEDADEIKERMEAALFVANNKSKEAAEKAKNAEELLSTLDEIDNPMERQQQANLAKELNQSAKDLYLQATTAYNLGNNLKDQHTKAQNEADESKLTYESIQNAVNEKDHDKAFKQLNDLKERLNNIISATSTESDAENMNAKAKEAKAKADKEFETAKEFRKEEEKLNLRLNQLNRDFEKASAKDKPSIQVQIDEIKEQIAMNAKWAEESYAKAEKLDAEADALYYQSKLYDDLAYDIENSGLTALTDAEKDELASFMKDNQLKTGIDNNEDAINNIKSDMTFNTENNSENNTASNNANNTNENNEINENNTSENNNNENTSSTKVSTIENEIAQFDPKNDFQAIENNTSLSEEEKLTQKNAVYNNLIETYNEKIEEIDQAIASSNDETEKEDLQTLKQSLETSVENYKSEIQENDNLIAEVSNETNENNTNNANTASTKVSSFENEIAQFDPKNDFQAIESNTSLSEEEKLTQKNTVYNNLIETYNEKIEEIDQAIESSNDETEKEDLQTLKQSLETSVENYKSEIQENDNLIAQISNETNENNTNENTSSNKVATFENDIAQLNPENEIDAIENNSSLTESEKLSQKNAVYNELIDKYDYKIVEVNKALIESNDPEERETLMELRKSLNTTRDDYEELVNENENLITASKPILDENASDVLKQLYNETQENVNDSEMYSGSFTNEKSYKNQTSADIIASVSDDKSNLNIKEQEKVDLENKLEEETKAKKQEKIEVQIENKNDEINDLKESIGASVFEADQSELEYNDELLSEELASIKSNKPNYEKDENYIKAKIFNDEAEKQRTDAENKIEQASRTTDKDEKSTLLEEAHQLNTAAINNQREAIAILEEVSNENYVVKTIPLTSEEENELATNKSANTTDNNTNETSNNEVTNNETNNVSENNNANNETENIEVSTNETNTSDNNTTDTSENNEVANNENNSSENINNEATNTNESNNSNNVNSTESNEVATNETNTSENDNTENTNVTENNENNTAENNNTTANNNSETENNEVANNETNTSETNTADNTNETENNEVATNETNTSETNTVTNTANKTTELKEEDFITGNASQSMLINNSKEKGIQKVEVQEVNEKTYDPKNENPDTYEVSNEVSLIDYSNNDSFNSSSATDILESNEKSLGKIRELNAEKNALNIDAQNAQSEKDKNKIDKKVDKIDTKIVKEELKVDESIQQITQIEVDKSKSNLEKIKSQEIPNSETNTKLEQSSNYETKANELLEEAQDLRTQADSEKDKTVKGDLLKTANSKEIAAAKYFDEASQLYKEGQLRNVEKSIENKSNFFSSDDLYAIASDFNEESTTLTQKAIESRDAALLAKGDEKINLQNEADTYGKQANSFRDLSNSYRKLADRQKLIEEENEVNEQLLAQLSKEDVENLKANEYYPEYLEKQNEINALVIEKSELEGEKKGIDNIIFQQEQQLKDYTEKQKSASQNEKSQWNENINNLSNQLKENKDNSAALTSKIEALDNRINNKSNSQEELIAALDAETQKDFEALMISNYDKTPAKKTYAITFEDLISSNFVVPETVTSNIIAVDNTIKYSDDNPIPLNVKNPKGLIYKVQVGAFSKPIPNDVFSGFAPISGEQVGNLVRYRVGYFLQFDNANDAKNQIRAMGYSDAFVVAINDGERINLSEARNLERNGVTATSNELATNNTNANNTTSNSSNTENNNQNNNNEAVVNNESTNNNETAINNTTNTNTNNQNTNNTNAQNATETIDSEVDVNLGEGTAATKNADKIQGLYFTVQLGAFSKPIQATDVYNISPLVTKFVGNLYKYSTGIYRSVNDAVVRKNEVVALGNSDAFVTAYYNGEKISVTKAQQLIEQQGESVFASDDAGNLKQSNPNNANSSNASNVAVTASGAFQVDLGSYVGEIPTDIANAMLMVPQFEVKTESKSGAQRYFVGNFSSEADAQKVVDLYKEVGIENLQIINKDNPTTPSGPRAVPGVIYKVFLGTYTGEVPGNRAITFVDLKDEGIKKVAEDNGDETYYAGEKSLYSEAQVVLKKFTSRGVSIAEIKAFQNGENIPLEDAKKMTGE